MEPNIFNYATSELSQDAFICYLLSFAMEDNKNYDKGISECAFELLRKMGIDEENITVTAIHKQYANIDVLVEVNNKYNVIIEDKTFTSQHSNQINRYKEALEKEGRSNIICVYYKIIEQDWPEKGVVNITRKDLLNIFTKYTTNNTIFNNYVEHLKAIDEDVNSYKKKPIGQWNDNMYGGFFTHLIENKVIELSKWCGYGRVNNIQGGFMGLWWYFLKNDNEDSVTKIGLDNKYIENIYLQIENNTIAIKMSITETDDNNMTRDIRWKLYNYFKEQVPDLKKKVFRPGIYMTVGYIEYDENNYKEKIELLERLMKNIENGAIDFNLMLNV